MSEFYNAYIGLYGFSIFPSCSCFRIYAKYCTKFWCFIVRYQSCVRHTSKSVQGLTVLNLVVCVPNILRLNSSTLISAALSTVVCCNNWCYCSVKCGRVRWLWMVRCGEVCGKNKPLPSTRHCPYIWLESLTKTTEHLSLVFTLDSKWVPSECEALPVYQLSSLHSRCVRIAQSI